MSSKQDLMTAEETAEILGINLSKLYKICDEFDARPDDIWDLLEGEHFEWLNRAHRTRRFYEEGAMAIAKYLQETVQSKPVIGFIDRVIEGLTNRRKRTRQMLIRRRVIGEFKELDGIVVRGELVFLSRPKVIRILATNGKGLNAAAQREQNNDSLTGREPMQDGVHFAIIGNPPYGRQGKPVPSHWSQRGLVRIAQNMSENLSQKSRKAWAEAVAEVCEDAIELQQKSLNSFEAKVQRAMKEAKERAKGKCQVSLLKVKPEKPFDLNAHHLFDKSTYPEWADQHDNLLVMHEDLHQGFHRWHGSESCEPKHFIDYLITVESWRFKSNKMTKHLHELINRLEKVQSTYEKRK